MHIWIYHLNKLLKAPFSSSSIDANEPTAKTSNSPGEGENTERVQIITNHTTSSVTSSAISTCSESAEPLVKRPRREPDSALQVEE